MSLIEKQKEISNNNNIISNNNYEISKNESLVYEKGKEKEREIFWKTYQNEGARTDYRYTFANEGWTVDTFKPRYDIAPTGQIEGMFYCSNIQADLPQLLEKLGVSLSFGNLVQKVNFLRLFGYSKFTRIGEVDLRMSRYALNEVFLECDNLVTIDKLIVDESTIFANSTFQYCTALENLTIEGTIGQNGLNVQWSPLTYESLESIADALEYKGNYTGEWIVTIGSENYSRLDNNLIQTIESKGWTIL